MQTFCLGSPEAPSGSPCWGCWRLVILPLAILQCNKHALQWEALLRLASATGADTRGSRANHVQEQVVRCMQVDRSLDHEADHPKMSLCRGCSKKPVSMRSYASMA